MDLYVAKGELAALEVVLANLPVEAPAAAQAPALIELAWHLRQRDSARALKLSSEAAALQPSTAQRARIALTRCEIAALSCQLDAAEAQLAEARTLLGPGTDPLAEGDALLAEAVVAKARGQRERELEAYDRGAAFFAALPDPRRLAVAQAWAAYERAFTEPEASVRIPAAEADPAVDALGSAARGVASSRREPAQAAALLLRASEQAQRVGLVRLAVICTINAGAALQGLSDFDPAAACFDVAATVARQTGWPALIGSSETRLGAFLKELGRLDDSHAVLVDALAWLAVTPAGINKANACSALAQTLLAMGRGIEAVGPMAEAIAMYREAQSTDNLALNLIGQARALSAAGQAALALAAIEEAQALITRHDFSALVVGVCEALAEIHQRHALPPPPDLTAPSAALHYAEATLNEGLKIAGWKPPASLYVHLADGWAATGDMARAYGYARKALDMKDQDAALKLLHPLAVLRLRQQGSAPSFDAEGLWRPAPAPESGEAQPLSAKLLSPKEREILQLLARNYSNKEIATALEVGDETVKWHLKKIYTKLDAGSRKHAVTRARSLGVISFNS